MFDCEVYNQQNVQMRAFMNLTLILRLSITFHACDDVVERKNTAAQGKTVQRRGDPVGSLQNERQFHKKKKTLSKFVETRKNVKVRDRRSDTLQGMIYTFNMIFRMVCLVTFYSVGYGPDSFVVRIALRWLCVWLGFE